MKVSVITVCKNSEAHIEKAVRSLVNQTYADREYVIIDGGSTDATLSILDRYRDHIDVLVSEADSGVYNAMNKGIGKASGDVLYFLNSDDRLHDRDVIADVVAGFRRHPGAMILYGDVILTGAGPDRLIKYGEIGPRFFYKDTLCHQSLFARAALFREIGHFDEKYFIHADVDWLMRVYFGLGNVFRYVDRTICFFSGTGLCSNPVLAERHKYDRQEISAKYFREARIKLAIKRVLARLRLRDWTNESGTEEHGS
jgi:glycosyltransferase involved in cell wall biosynthesis